METTKATRQETTTMKTHEHKTAKYRMIMEPSGVDRNGGYLYGYRETCECGASKKTQYRSASDAEAALKGATDEDSK
jgi:hypothetical protein